MADETQPSPTHPEVAGNVATIETNSTAVDLVWVWREVRKRVFIKLPFSLGVADAMEAVVPIALEDDTFVCGLASRDFPLSGHLHAVQVRNTIENILRQAAQRQIRFELIEGTQLSDWQHIKDRQHRAHSAVVAIAEQKLEEHHFEDVLNQVVSEMRRRITSTRDRTLPQVRAHLMLDLIPQLADVEDMLFAEHESHDRRRAMARAIDRIASFLEVQPFTLALEIERHRNLLHATRAASPNSHSPSETPAKPEPTPDSSVEQPSS